MELGKPSRTAVNTALWRAVHTLLDGEPKILADPYARAFAGFADDEALLAAHDAHPASRIPGLRLAFAVRNRYAEDELAEAVGRGVGQYVILGAGLDSFAYRRPDLMRSLDVFEVDHPASQAWKRARVAELGIEAPARLRHVPIDFERETLAEGLAAGGLRPGERAFFSWLGVTQYLTRETVERTLRDVAAATAPGSVLSRWAEVLYQFLEPEMLRGHACLAACLLRCQPQHPSGGLAGQRVYRPGLPIGGDKPLQLAPELIHGVQLGSLLGQPQQPDAERRSQRLRAVVGVRAGPVGQQPDRAGGAVAAPHLSQERPGIGAARTRADEHDPVRGPQVDDAEQHPLGVRARDRHRRLRALERPGRAQRWKQPQQCPVAAQQHAAGAPAGPQLPDQCPFFWARCAARPA